MQCTLREVEPEKKMRISGGNSACDSILCLMLVALVVQVGGI